MDHDKSDILGQKTMPRSNASRGSAFSFSMTQAVFTSILIVGTIVVGRRLWRRILMWRERSFRLATRRRHGIPDSDQRPFNVAYSEAMTRARDDESKRPLKPRPSFRPQAPQLDQRQAVQEQQNLRNRTGAPLRSDSEMRPPALPVPGRYSSGSYGPSSQTQVENNQDTFIGESSTDRQGSHVNGVATNGLIRQGGYVNIEDYDAMSDGEGRKRGFEEEMVEEHEAKKSRVEGDELIDGDEDAEFEEFAPKRGSKRGLHDDDNEEFVGSKKSRGKRARKVSQNYDMDVDDEEADEITELKSTTRGKKRDRAEAGSTFGGDDEDSGAELVDEGDAKARRRRKRRTVAKRKSEASYARGKKRDRDGEEDSNENISEESSPEKRSSHKKGKRTSHGGHRDLASKSDVSMDESITSTKSKVRNIGDEWESNGIKYKIGLNGQRLRQALVKKARQKFVMPKDSQHPDRDANLQVCIETWLTEEEYQEAKAQHTLAWQDSPQEKETRKLSLDISDAAPVPQGPSTGKNLLWSSTTTTPTGSPGPQSPPPESVRHRSYRHSIATTTGLPINPFTNSQIPTAKRIASNARAIVNGSPGLSDSTNGSPRTPYKVFSKWEKQELEAQAMMKIREANKKKELEKESKLKEERELAERRAAEQQRLERERLERQRAEKEERVNREKAEAERKKREEAEKAAVPNITVTAPSAQPGLAPATAANTPVPNNLFSVPGTASTPSPFGALKVAQATSGQPSSTPSFFNNPAQPSSNATQPPSATQSPVSSGFSFNPSGTSSTNSAPGPFSAPAAKKDEANANTSSQAQGSSLLSRLGPQAPEASKTQTQPTSTPLFSFPKADSSSNTGNTQNAFSQPAAGGASVSSNGGSGLKFSFGVPNKTATSTPSTNGNAPAPAFPSAPSSLSGALGSDAQKASAGPFSFKTPTTPASATNTATASTTPVSAPKFSFGTSAFGSQPSTQNKEPVKSAFGNAPAPSAFGNTNSTSAFGNKNPTPAFGNTNTSSTFGNTTSSAFGNTNTTSAFGNNASSAPSPFGATAAQTSNVFGGGGGANTSGSKPAEGNASKPLFSFANSNSTAASTNAPSSTGTGAKPMFSFASNTQTPSNAASTTTSTTTSASGGSAPFSFKFGQTSSTAAQSSPFGAAPSSGQSAFGNLGGTTNNAPSAFGGGAFGAPAQPK